jgi:hypothetical protein
VHDHPIGGARMRSIKQAKRELARHNRREFNALFDYLLSNSERDKDKHVRAVRAYQAANKRLMQATLRKAYKI